MAVAAGVVTAFGLSAFRQLGLGAASPAAIALQSLSLLVPSAFALVVGALAGAEARSSSLTDMLLAFGVSGERIVAAKLAAVLQGSLTIVAAGYGAAALVLIGSALASDVAVFAALFVVVMLTTSALAALGMLLGAIARHGQTVALALGAWLVMAVGLDLVLIAATPLLRLGAPVLFVVLALDPIESGRILGLLTLGADSALLGPIGALTRQTLGVGLTAAIVVLVDVLWIGLGTLAAGRAIARRS